MTIKEIMNIGTKGMSKEQKEAEQERRLKVCEKINTIGRKIQISKADGNKAKARQYSRELNRIKGEESEWLKSAAWFMYA